MSVVPKLIGDYQIVTVGTVLQTTNNYTCGSGGRGLNSPVPTGILQH